jgi:hypothetical protein
VERVKNSRGRWREGKGGKREEEGELEAVVGVGRGGSRGYLNVDGVGSCDRNFLLSFFPPINPLFYLINSELSPP